MFIKNKYKKHLKLLKSPYDSRDYKFKDLLGAPIDRAEIPDEYVTPPAGFCYDQGHSSMCAPSAFAYMRYLQERDYGEQSGLTEAFSPTFNYANRKEGEDFEGMYLRSLLDKAIDDGSVLFEELPYPLTYNSAKRVFLKKKDELLRKADNFKISSYFFCSSRRETQKAIMETGSVIIGVPVYESFYKPDKNGYIKYVPGQEDDGGHAILVTGWKIKNGKLWWKIQNSWGSSWGDDGSAWLPEEYPWLDGPYAVLDYNNDLNFEEYKKKFNID